jgi:4-hydroxy-3-methylbut-2-enyl diphosphate reductase IspH
LWYFAHYCQQQNQTLNEVVNEYDDQRQVRDIDDSKKVATSNGRRSVVQSGPRCDDVIVVGSAARRSHGTWAHGATIAGSCYRSNDGTTCRTEPPSGGVVEMNHSTPRDFVKHSNDIMNITNKQEALLRVAVSCSTAIVTSTGDVSCGRRHDLTISDVIDSRGQMDRDERREAANDRQPVTGCD